MFTHKTAITVRYCETDRMGVVYYANHFVWFEIARTEFLKARGVSYRELEDRKNRFMMVLEARCKYLRPVTYEDTVTVEAWVSALKHTSVSFAYKVTLGNTTIAEGMTSHVFTDARGKPKRIPAPLSALLHT